MVIVYYCMIWNLAHKFGGVDISRVSLEVLPRIKDAFDVLLRQHDCCNALTLAKASS